MKKLSLPRNFKLTANEREQFGINTFTIDEAVTAAQIVINEFFLDLRIEQWFDDEPITRQNYLTIVIQALVDNISGLQYKECSLHVFEEKNKGSHYFDIRWRIGEHLYREADLQNTYEYVVTPQEANLVFAQVLVWATTELNRLTVTSMMKLVKSRDPRFFDQAEKPYYEQEEPVGDPVYGVHSLQPEEDYAARTRFE